MSVILILIPLSLLVAGGFLGAFVWAVRRGQFEDTGTPPLRMLADDEGTPRPTPPTTRSSRSTHEH
ncbi:MAG: cbb3-type cytochrome oxidase assembly protein CcoS [Limisphaerales bacterium]